MRRAACELRVAMRETWCAARQGFVANPGANESSLPPAMGHSSLRTRRPDLLSREFGCCNVVTVARAFELGAKWEATPAVERGVGQFIHRLRRDAA